MLQRVRVKLTSDEDVIMSYKYNYPLMCEIYKKISLTDKSFSELYHKVGVKSDLVKRNFKLLNCTFNFKRDIIKDHEGIHIKKGQAFELVISGKKDIVVMILSGFFFDEKININGQIFRRKDIITEEPIKFQDISVFEIKTPLVESISNVDPNTKRRYDYLDINDKRFVEALIQNIKRKYEVIYNKPCDEFFSIGINKRYNYKRKTITVKDGEIFGHLNVDIMIQGDKKIQEIGYYCGFGSHNLLGAGFSLYKGGF